MDAIQGLSAAAAFALSFAVLILFSPLAGIIMVGITTVLIMWRDD